MNEVTEHRIFWGFVVVVVLYGLIMFLTFLTGSFIFRDYSPDKGKLKEAGFDQPGGDVVQIPDDVYQERYKIICGGAGVQC